ncbi:unnamed protein product [Nippostrongylus brasiliensis]|uniref:I-set domain-containing protein n=1 Tax=Nippostrongylus brasiliensis TaxID=27835 RepID=A0A0N4YYL7_NIPBR|nr:unnamed protein product [Nippostrongylus brasiliensis]
MVRKGSNSERLVKCQTSFLSGGEHDIFEQLLFASCAPLMRRIGELRSLLNFEPEGSLAVLKLTMVTPEDSGEYTVVAENNFGKVSFIQQSHSLKTFFV